jgi:septal ring-binding cell division protein DamX
MASEVKYKQHLFIYDRKEILILMLLILMISLFAFTLGIHLGKRVGAKTFSFRNKDAAPVQTVPDAIPNRQEFTEHGKVNQQILEDTLNQELHDEVTRAGIALEHPVQVDLPKKTLFSQGGATSLNSSHPTHSPATAPVGRKYTLQIGSYPVLDDAKKQISEVEAAGLKPFLRETDIKGKGKWFRLYLDEFPTRKAAEEAGENYRSQHKIASFIVTPLVD